MSSSGDAVSWIQWFCTTRGNDFYCEIDEDYISDQFNLTGLNEFVPKIKAALDKVLDYDTEDSREDSSQNNSQEIEEYAEKLYGLIHARFILTNKGLSAMLEKWQDSEFGTCPRVLCKNNPLLPIGLHDTPGVDTVKLFCTACDDIYQPRHARHQPIDGAYFGTSFPEMMLMVHPDMRRTAPISKFVPKLYGFQVHSSANQN